jgi:hypothetical protein
MASPGQRVHESVGRGAIASSKDENPAGSKDFCARVCFIPGIGIVFELSEKDIRGDRAGVK